MDLKLFLKEIQDFKPQFEIPLAKFTTWRIGGPAEILVQTDNSSDLQKVLLSAIKNQIPYTIIGNGSNILVSDQGVRGLVIINKSKNITLGPILDSRVSNEKILARHTETGDKNFYSFSDLDYQENGPEQLVTFDSGVMLPYAINWIFKNNLTGLQWFAGIPGSIGGSFYNNIHGGSRHFSEYFYEAKIIHENGIISNAGYDFFEFGYDKSILRTNPKIVVLQVTLKLIQGDTVKAKSVANEWLKRKSIQPKISCGSVFQCLTDSEQLALGYPTPSIGYIVDKILHLKGKQIGDAQISITHGNFIPNLGQAKASQVLELMKDIISQTKDKIGVKLHPEINFLGFDKKELDELE
jgi:UDP-N-acetylmuramate dehydrogenase